MARDQSALLELLAELKLTDTTDRIRQMAERLYQELIDAEAAAVIGVGPSTTSAWRKRNHHRSRIARPQYERVWDGSSYGAITMSTLPAQLPRPLTSGRGTEMSAHAQFKVETGIPVFFADPQSPWQRSMNENTNGLLRQYLPSSRRSTVVCDTRWPSSRVIAQTLR